MTGCARSHLRMPGSAGAGHAALNGRASSGRARLARVGRAERRRSMGCRSGCSTVCANRTQHTGGGQPVSPPPPPSSRGPRALVRSRDHAQDRGPRAALCGRRRILRGSGVRRRLSACGVAGSRGGGRRVRPCQSADPGSRAGSGIGPPGSPGSAWDRALRPRGGSGIVQVQRDLDVQPAEPLAKLLGLAAWRSPQFSW